MNKKNNLHKTKYLIMVLLSPFLLLWYLPAKYANSHITYGEKTGKKNDPTDFLIKFIWFLPIMIWAAATTIILISELISNLNSGNSNSNFVKQIFIPYSASSDIFYLLKYSFIWTIPVIIIMSIVHTILFLKGKNQDATILSSYYNSLKFKSKSKSNISKKLADGRWAADDEIYKNYNSIQFSGKEGNYKIRNTKLDKEHGFIVNSKLNNDILDVLVSKTPLHLLLIGATRSGKTSRIYNPQIRFLSKTKEKPTMIVTDPKGELLKFHANALSSQGYEVLQINLLKNKNSDMWNPLSSIWDQWDPKNKKKLENPEWELNKSQAKDRIIKLSGAISPDGKGEAIWTSGARGIFQFMILAFLEQAEIDENLTKKVFNFGTLLGTLQNSHSTLLQYLDSIKAIALAKGVESRAISTAASYIDQDSKTYSNMLSNLVTSMQVFAISNVKQISSETTIDIDNTKPQAIFIIFPDFDNSFFKYISLFVNETYKELVTKIKGDGKLERPVYYILDEFGNFPVMPQFSSMLSIGAGRNIFFSMAVQNIAQISEKYNDNELKMALGNTGIKIFLGGSLEDRQYISSELGDVEIEVKSDSRNISSNQAGNGTESTSKGKRPLRSAEDLNNLAEGTAIVITMRMKPQENKLAKFWEWKGWDSKGSPFQFPDNRKTSLKVLESDTYYNFASDDNMPSL